MKYFLEIDLENDAFAMRPGAELARIMRSLADRVEDYSFVHPRTMFPVRDVNGNRVGAHGYKRSRRKFGNGKPHGQTRALKNWLPGGSMNGGRA